MAEPGPSNSLEHLLTALDPKSLILSQFSADSEKPNLLQLRTEGFFMERGPRYKAYVDLRESKLIMKCLKNPPSLSPQFDLTPPKKQVKFQGSLMGSMSLKSSLKSSGSKSTNAGEKWGGGGLLMARKSWWV